MEAPAGGRRLGHWTVIVPLLSLCGWGVGFVAHQFRGETERPLDVTPPPETQIAPIVFPPRSHTLFGTVAGADGAFVGDALVSLVAADEPHWTYTNAQGAFRLEGLERGPWTLTVAASAHQPFTTTVENELEPVAVRLPDAARVLPRLAPRSTARLQGLLQAASGAALEGCEVIFTPRLPLEQIDAPFPRRAVCDGAGRFEIADLQLGQYTIAVLPEWAQFGSWPDLTRAEDADPLALDHRGAAGEPLAIAIAAGSAHGRVTDREHNPLEGALVLLNSETTPERIWPPVRADAHGDFVVPDLPPGRYAVTVNAGSGSHRSTILVHARESVEIPLPPLQVERPR